MSKNNDDEAILDHQDWKPIIMNAGKRENKNVSKVTVNKIDPNSAKLKSIEKKADNDELKHKKIDNELRMKIIQGRNAKNFTQKQLANSINLPLQVVSDIESGKAIYNHQHINKIKRYLKI